MFSGPRHHANVYLRTSSAWHRPHVWQTTSWRPAAEGDDDYNNYVEYHDDDNEVVNDDDNDADRVAEVARERGWHPPKSLDSGKKFEPEHTLFCRELRFVAIYTLFGDLWAKKVPFWVKNSVSWARSALLHGIYCIFHRVNFAILRLCAKTTHLTQKL